MKIRKCLNGMEPPERRQLAAECGTTVEYLWHLASGHRKASPALAKAIEAATGGAVSRAELRPDIWE